MTESQADPIMLASLLNEKADKRIDILRRIATSAPFPKQHAVRA